MVDLKGACSVSRCAPDHTDAGCCPLGDAKDAVTPMNSPAASRTPVASMSAALPSDIARSACRCRPNSRWLRAVLHEVRHNLWRVCEPQYTRATERLADLVVMSIEALYELLPRAAKPISSSVRPPFFCLTCGALLDSKHAACARCGQTKQLAAGCAVSYCSSETSAALRRTAGSVFGEAEVVSEVSKLARLVQS